MNRRGFTLIELAIFVGIIAIIAFIAIPNILESRKPHVVAQTYVKVRATGDLVYVLGRNQQVGDASHPVWVCRLDHGPNTVPRYVETNFTEGELVPAVWVGGEE